jgi:hypothetical protein
MKFKQLYRSPRLRGALRVASFLAAANLTLSALLLPQARANAEEAVKRGGLSLLQQLGPSLIGSPEVATINGQHMSLASKTTPLSIEQVLGRFQQHCSDNSGGLAEELRALPESAALLERLPVALRDAAGWSGSRELADDGKSGHLACVTRKDSGGGVKGLFERVLAFAETGDVSAIGDPRYVVARRDEKSGQTHVLAMWTEGSFNIPAMFPDEGDAPGSDSRYVPRPPGSRRVLTAEIADHPYAMRMYDTEKSHAEVLGYYEKQLAPRGFRLNPLPAADDAELDLSEHVRAFSKDGVAVIVVTNVTPAEQTGVTLIEMGSLGFAKATARVEGPFE